jgi:hypothetical protein
MNYDVEQVIEAFSLDSAVADLLRQQDRELTRLQRQVKKLTDALDDPSWRIK